MKDRHSKGDAREMQGRWQALGRLMEQLRSRLGAGKEQARSKLEYGWSMARVWLEHLLVRGERTLGTSRAHSQYVGNVLQSLRYAVLLMMVMIGVNVWGQNSGVYYIASQYDAETESDNTLYSNGSQETHFYIVPAEKDGDASELAYYTAGNAGKTKPYLTTYQTNRDNNSVWILKKISENSYQIIHAKTGKYVEYAVPNSNKPSRRVVHLVEQTEAQASANSNTLFTITTNNNNSLIVPNALSESTGNKYWNVAGHNKAQYYAANPNDNSQGLIGVYSSTTGLSIWHVEDAILAASTITISDVNPDNSKVTVTVPDWLPAGYNIRYTIGDGTQADPTASTGTCIVNQNGTPNEISIGQSGTLKVVVERYGVVLTEVASKVVSPAIVAPTVTNNFDGTISLSTTTTGATIYYTTNGSTPDNTSTPYSSAFSLGSATIIKAIAYLGSEFSGVTTYNVSQYTTPTISFNSSTSQVTITSSGTVYYTTDGGTPTTSSTEYSTPFTVSSATTVKAIAIHAGYITSEVATQTIEKLVSPSVSFDDVTQKVNITTNSAVEEATSVYTTDGNPTPSSTEYSEPISLTGTTTVKAMTVKDGYINSDVASLTVTKLASAPSISRSGSTVTLSCSDPDATIYYTTDGTTPSLESTPYIEPFSLVGDQKFTIKATATKAGFLNSDVAEQVIDNRSTIPAPSISVEGNTVTITANDIGDEIYYTTDGSTPTTETATHFTTSGSFSLESGSSYTIKAIASYGEISSSEATETVDLTDSGYAGIYYIQSQSNNREYFMYPVGGESTYVKTAKNSDKNAIWKIEKVGDYYRIIHYEDGKYLVAADATKETNTVSLVETNSPGETALFEITRKSGSETNLFDQIILFRPKAAANASGHIYLNTTSGNDGTHTIGLWDNTGSSEWRLGKVPLSPTFTVADVKVTMENTLGDVYYTIDGSTPTSSSTKGKSVTLNYGPSYTVKAISIYKDPKSDETWQSDVASKTVKVNVLPPTYSVSGNTVQLRSSQEGVSFRYTTDDNVNLTATTGEAYNNTTGIVLTNGNVYTLRALAYNTVSGTNYLSAISTIEIDLREAVEITSLAGIVSATGNYKLASSFTATGTPSNNIGTSSNPFKGTIDGQLNEFSLSQPLFDYVEDAIIKNVIVSSATVSTSGNAGVIANNALGATRIYNCGIKGGTVSGSAYTGGLVGLLDGSARVINCYSYADIIGGSYVGGIVGYNNVATTATNLKTMVMNCMFYGNITGGTNKAPIYNGEIITNVGDKTGVSNFNYFLADATFTGGIDKYNCALMAETRFLQRFEFFRHLLNSNRELAAWWATGNMNKEQMMKWVMEPSQISSDMPYPILKTPGKYASVVNYTPSETAYDEEHRNEGRKLTKMGSNGKLSVTIQMGTGGAQYTAPTGARLKTGQSPTFDLTITDKDFEHFNFNYGKVQLPYYNDYCEGNYTGNRVVTGWKIVNISGGTTSFTTGSDAETNASGEITSAPYNFADRNCTEKDLYSKSGRVFAQGAYFDVPEGVTSITIQPYWAKCVYLADAYADVVYNGDMKNAYNVPNVGGGKIYTDGSSYSIAGDNQVVYTSMGNATASSGSALFSGGDAKDHTVYDYAVVLVGNYHRYNGIESSNSKPYTITSIDLDGDNEPDYSYILRFDARMKVHPVRIDFLNVPGLGMAQKSTGSKGSYNFGIMQPISWFEVTNTALFRVTQFEYEHNDRAAKPLILHGGVIEQWVSGQSGGNGQRTTYIHVGSNVWFKEFHLGCHQDATLVTKHPPVSVTGGDYNEFYLTGLYSAASNCDDNAECYINGGRFDKVAGTGIEGIGNTSTHTNGNIVWQIQNADIEEFYGGGINAAKPIEGSITTVITGSHVKRFCGGPKFGDMKPDKTVITTATNCTFGSFFGAGYGGNSYNRAAPGNFTGSRNYSWNSWIAGTTKGNVAPSGSSAGDYPGGVAYEGYKQNYISNFGGVSTRFDYQFLPQSDNVNNVGRLFIDFVNFSLATTRNVTSTLTGCTITGNFYGGGSLGKVDGDVTSTLTDCTVRGSVFGGGYDATRPTVQVLNTAGFTTPPNYNEETGVFFPAAEPYNTSIEYTWEHRETVNSTETAIDKEKHILYTTADLTTLGQVTGDVTLNISGNTLVEGQAVDYEGNLTGGDRGGVFGGGDASAVLGNTTVTINATALQEGATYNAYCVYGGGNIATVGGNSTVNLQGNTEVLGNVFGGGNKGPVEGSATVNIEDEEEEPAEP